MEANAVRVSHQVALRLRQVLIVEQLDNRLTRLHVNGVCQTVTQMVLVVNQSQQLPSININSVWSLQL